MKLINPLSPDASYLYHYTSTDTALNHILKSGTLKFNSYGLVNDPRENKEWDISPFVRADLNFSLEQYNEKSREISNMFKANAKLVCFSRDKDEAIGKWQPEALFDRGFAKPSMWHHYGDKHCGLCLMFDRNKLHKAFVQKLETNRLQSGRVTYSNEGKVPSLVNDPFVINLTACNNDANYLSTIQEHLDIWFPKLFLRKLTDWANEDEYRWVYLDSDPDPRYVDFEDALEAIVIGENVPKTHYEDILRYCVKYHADVANLNWHNGYPKIERPGQPYLTHKHLANL